MQIDWFTYGAQIVNFLILLYLLRRFLYEPLLGAMASRAEHLRAQFTVVEEKAAKAEALIAEYQQRQSAFEAEKGELLAAVQEEVAQRRRTMIAEAREEVESMQSRWYAAVEQEKEDFLHELRLHVSSQLFDLARNVLEDLAHVELEAAMVTIFCDKLAALDRSTRHSIAKSLNRSTPTVIINSTFPLCEEMRSHIDRQIQQIFAFEEFPREIAVRFRQNPSLISGLELVVQDRRLAWSVDDHLTLLEKRLSRALDDALAARDNHEVLFAAPGT